MENIQAGTWTASEVLEAYIARAAQAQQAMNCLTEGTCVMRIGYLKSVVVMIPRSLACLLGARDE